MAKTVNLEISDAHWTRIQAALALQNVPTRPVTGTDEAGNPIYGTRSSLSEENVRAYLMDTLKNITQSVESNAEYDAAHKKVDDAFTAEASDWE
jgi:hypothetical protein